MFLRGLLDVTDNRVANVIVPPPDTVRHDPDDPYLVVAADKGTATFSDYANAIAHEYGFWLDDAFASGGSVGYDHKRMAITARGAWESVRPNSREWGLTVSHAPRAVIAIRARWAWIRRQPTLPWSVSATCQVMYSATACCSRVISA